MKVEHLAIGQFGQFSIYLAFAAALVAAISFFISTQLNIESEQILWKRLGKISFLVHAVSVLAIVASLFFIIYNHYYEYRYAWEHSSNALPVKYMLSCFWSGQEGSFLLWIWWTMVLGLILLFKNKFHNTTVMFVFSAVLVFLMSMLLGLQFPGFNIGSTPFILLKDSDGMVGLPVFKMANYINLDFFKDGKDLNPLLQNYWMVIHPPTLFLGFASTLVPFAFAIAALWKKDFTNWMKPVLPWVLFNGAVLGTGIMMGGAWAYESLSFGGYWAWDAVENASLVPWIIMIAGLHTLVAAQKTGHSLRITFVFLLMSFLLMVYAGFLTRSGALQNTSVHAFTDEGMKLHLLIFLFSFILFAKILLLIRWKQIPAIKKEEETWTREFWMFIGSLVFLISALHITIVMSFPVWNSILHTKWTLTHDKEHYNSVQLPIAVIITLLSTFALFLKFRKSGDMKSFWKKIFLFSFTSLALTTIFSWLLDFSFPENAPVMVLFFAGLFSVIANFYYVILTIRGKMRLSGPAVAHLGFGVMMVGVLISSAKQNPISLNTKGYDFGKNFSADEQPINILLNKNIADTMSNYRVTYIGDSAVPPHRYFKVRYEKLDAKGNITEKFMLMPESQENPTMGGLIANPSTRHYLNYDLFTHISSYYSADSPDSQKDFKFKEYKLKVGDSINTINGVLTFNMPKEVTQSNKTKIENGDKAIEGDISIRLHSGIIIQSTPLLVFHGNVPEIFADTKPEIGFSTKILSIDPKTFEFTISVAVFKPEHDFIVMKAIIFPGINLLWLGTFIMIAGFVISIIRIFQKRRKEKTTIA